MSSHPKILGRFQGSQSSLCCWNNPGDLAAVCFLRMCGGKRAALGVIPQALATLFSRAGFSLPWEIINYARSGGRILLSLSSRCWDYKHLLLFVCLNVENLPCCAEAKHRRRGSGEAWLLTHGSQEVGVGQVARDRCPFKSPPHSAHLL